MKFTQITTLLICLMVSSLAWADTEPNNSIATAEAASLGTLAGTLGTASDLSDFYLINLPADGKLTATLTTVAPLQARVLIYNQDGGSSVFGGYVTGGTIVLDRDCMAQGPAYVEVQRNAGAAAYTLNLALTSVPEANDIEPNNTLFTGQALAFEGTTTGHLGYLNGAPAPLDGNDYYVTVPPANGRINISLSVSNGLQARLVLYNNAGTLQGVSGFTTTTASLVFDCLAPDTLRIWVDQNSGCGGYTLSYTWEEPLFANDPEPNNTFNSGSALEGFSEVTGQLGYVNLPDIPLDASDYYATRIPTNGQVNIQLITTNTLQARILFYNRNRALLGTSAFITNDTIVQSFSCLLEDSAFILVSRNAGCGAYKLSYSVDSPDVARDPEPNDSFDDAIFLGQGVGAERTGHIGFVNGTSDQNDYYFGVPSADGKISIRVINDGAQQSRVLLYNDNRVSLGAGAYSTDTVFLEVDCVAGGDTVYFQVQNNSGCGGYQLNYSTIPNLTPNDVEPNNSIAEAKTLGQGIAAKRTGRLGYANGTDFPTDASDFWRAKPSDDGKITITTVTTNTLQSRILLYSRSGVLLTSSTFITAGTTTLVYDCLLADTVYIQVNMNSGCGGYELWYEMLNPVQANDLEPNNVLADAKPLASNTQQGGHLGYLNSPTPVDAVDWYEYNPQSGGLLNFKAIFTNTLQARLLLYDAAGGLITFTGYVTADTLPLAYTAAGNLVYISVERASGCGGYTIEVDNGCAQPTGLNEPLIISIGAQVDWDNSPGAVAYNIQGKKASASTFTTGLNLVNSNYRAFPLQSCTNYTYRVESVCASRTSGYTPLKTFTTLCAPFCPALTGVTVASLGSTTATIGWAPSIVNTGAQLSYTPVGGSTSTATAPGGTNFINLTGLTPNTTYDFQVRQSCYDGGISPFVSGSFTTTTLREGSSIQTVLYPNPANEQMVLQGLEQDQAALILNAQGQIVRQLQLTEGSNVIDVSQLIPGTYALRLTGENGQTIHFSIVR